VTFTAAQQKTHRAAFIAECRQKAWGAACHAAWISKNIDDLIAQFRKLQEEDKTLEADSKELAGALDSHTVNNRDKRKAIQEKRNKLAQEMQAISANAQQGQKALQQLLQSVESALALANYAETWEWKEVETTPPSSEIQSRSV
jgi:chromosome segregation ATPase